MDLENSLPSIDRKTDESWLTKSFMFNEADVSSITASPVIPELNIDVKSKKTENTRITRKEMFVALSIFLLDTVEMVVQAVLFQKIFFPVSPWAYFAPLLYRCLTGHFSHYHFPWSYGNNICIVFFLFLLSCYTSDTSFVHILHRSFEYWFRDKKNVILFSLLYLNSVMLKPDLFDVFFDKIHDLLYRTQSSANIS